MSSSENAVNMSNVEEVVPALFAASAAHSQPETVCLPHDAENAEQSAVEVAAPEENPKVTETPERNTGIVVVNADSESLSNLLVYDSDSSTSSSSFLSQSDIHVVTRHSWREKETTISEDGSDTDDSDVESTISAEPEVTVQRTKEAPKASYDLELEELPPVPDLSTLDLNPEGENYVHMGNVLAIIDKLVTIGATPNTPAYDLDTLLFLEEGVPLGPIFDVLGQVASPIYAVRFNTLEDITKLNVTPGMKVYSLPKSKHTQYVFLQQLLKMKGSDASWLGDREVPVEFADWSDDESESKQRWSHVTTHCKRHHDDDNWGGSSGAGGATVADNSAYKQYEKTMNQRNILNTKLSKCMDSYRHVKYSRPKQPKRQQQIASSAAPVLPPTFDPTIPPPSMMLNNNEMAAWSTYSLANHAYFVNYYGNSHPAPGPSHI